MPPRATIESPNQYISALYLSIASSGLISQPQYNARTNLGRLKKLLVEDAEYEDGFIVCRLHRRGSSCTHKLKSKVSYGLHIQDWAYATFAPELTCPVCGKRFNHLRSLKRPHKGCSANVRGNAAINDLQKRGKEDVESGIGRLFDSARQLDLAHQTPEQTVLSTIDRTEESPSGVIDSTGMAVPSVTGNTESSRESSSDEHENTAGSVPELENSPTNAGLCGIDQRLILNFCNATPDCNQVIKSTNTTQAPNQTIAGLSAHQDLPEQNTNQPQDSGTNMLHPNLGDGYSQSWIRLSPNGQVLNLGPTGTITSFGGVNNHQNGEVGINPADLVMNNTSQPDIYEMPLDFQAFSLYLRSPNSHQYT